MAEQNGGLVRAIGRWSLTALMVNTMIGASIFGLPSLLAARLGARSPVAYLVAAAGIAAIGACFAEVASQFREAGGTYLYAHTAFGRFTGIQIGWMSWLSRITAASAVANLFHAYLGQFLPRVSEPLPRVGVLAILIAVLATVNYRGVSGGNRLSNLFTIIKVALLAVFVSSGFAALLLHPEIRVTPEAHAATAADWFEAILLMVYAYGGFEAALFATGEVQEPRKDAPLALLYAISGVTLLYVSVQYVVIHTLPNAAASAKPAADAAMRFLGPLGGSAVAAGSLVAAYGYLSANMLHAPRLTFAMGERGDFPRPFGAIHPRFRTPHVSIVVFALMVVLFSAGGTFRWNAIVSAVSRLMMYGSAVAALPVLRKKRTAGEAFRLRAARLCVALGLLFTGVLASQIRGKELAVLAGTFALGLTNWLFVRHRTPEAAAKN